MFTKTFVALTALATAALAQTNIVVNGDFSNGVDGSSTVPSWTNSDTATSFIDASVFRSAPQSFASGALATNPSVLSQTLPTTAGTCYLITLYLSNDTAGDATTVGTTVSFGTLNASPDVAAQPLNTFVLYQYFSLATSPAQTLSVTTFNDNGYTNLDDVSVVDVPTVNCLTPSARARTRRTKRNTQAAQW